MTASLLSLVMSALLVGPPSSTLLPWGGWATITVEELPAQICAGQPLRLVFVVKQHGKTLLAGLKPTVEFNSGGAVSKVAATPGKSKGQYVAEVTFPTPGRWNITIHSGFGDSKLTMKPVTVSQASGESN